MATVLLAGGAAALVLLRDDGDGPTELVAMGDSYSAGVGLGDVTKEDCDRDPDAYGPQAASALDIADVRHVACSGAVTENLDGTQEIDRFGDDIVVPPQLDALSDGTDLVTLTIGGNDVDFAGKVVACLVGSCGTPLLELDPSSLADPELTWDDVEERLVDSYLDIAESIDPDGHLFVLSYPIPFEVDGGIAPCEGFELVEMQAANALATLLGDTIEAAAEEADDRSDGASVAFVDWRVGERIDDGYTAPSGAEYDYIDTENGICSDEPFLNGFDISTVVTGDATNNFHPNASGYEFAAEALEDAIGSTLDR